MTTKSAKKQTPEPQAVKANGPQKAVPASHFPTNGQLAALAGLAAIFLWAYWPTLVEIASRWALDPQYSHGYFVPLFALALLWLRRKQSEGLPWNPSAWGLSFLLAGLGLHLAGARFYSDWISCASILPTLAGICLGLGGWHALRWAWPSIAFLAFMLPLPFTVETYLALPLQRFATSASAFVLQLIGMSAVAEGNIITLENALPVQVVEACNGLGMLVTFFAMTTGVVLLLKRPWPDKVVVLLSAVPIALAANIARISITAVLAETVSQEISQAFHHHAEFFMMPFALGLIWLELTLLSRLFIERSAEDQTIFSFAPSGPAPAVVGSGSGKVNK